MKQEAPDWGVNASSQSYGVESPGEASPDLTSPPRIARGEAQLRVVSEVADHGHSRGSCSHRPVFDDDAAAVAVSDHFDPDLEVVLAGDSFHECEVVSVE